LHLKIIHFGRNTKRLDCEYNEKKALEMLQVDKVDKSETNVMLL
jgi:hypothetical protein